MRLVMLVGETRDARFRARVARFSSLGAKLTVAGFSRVGYYDAQYPRACKVVDLGEIKQGKYLGRIKRYSFALCALAKMVRTCDVIYAIGVDSGLLLWLASRLVSCRAPLVLEVQDIRPPMLRRGLVGMCWRRLDGWLACRADILVVTSPLYLKYYYGRVVHARVAKTHVIENKLYPNMPAVIGRTSQVSHQLSIGYFGVLRCVSSLKLILAVASAARGRILFRLRGVFLGISQDLRNAIEAHPQIEFGGAYESPDDLPRMYSSVDLVWACYPAQEGARGNWRWARTNRFYEACYFETPMIALERSGDGRIVKREGLGVCIRPYKLQSSLSTVLNITAEKIEEWRENVVGLPEQVYTEVDEHAAFLDKLRTLLKSR